jgi:hypothetical protein
MGGKLTRSAELRTGRVHRPVVLQRRGAWIEFADPRVPLAEIAATFVYPDGPITTSPLDGRSGFLVTGPREDSPRPERTPAQIDARAPDPHGGVPYGIGVVPSQRGGWCTGNVGRVVEDRVGPLDFNLGTLDDAQSGSYRCRGDSVATRKLGADVASGFSIDSPTFPGYDPSPGRQARRTQRGVSMIYGVTRADVVAVTIATPRDVRTLVPSKRAHAFVAVYDGDFPAGEETVSVRFRDGSSRVAYHTVRGGF